MYSGTQFCMFFFIILVVHYPQIATENIQRENRTAATEVYIEPNYARQQINTSNDNSGSTRGIELNGFQIIENICHIVDIQRQTHTISNKSTPKTKLHDLNLSETSRHSTIIVDQKGKEIFLNAIQLGEKRTSHEDLNTSFEEESEYVYTAYSTNNINPEGFHFNRTGEKILYDKQHSLAESEIVNGTLQDDSNNTFSWRRLYNITTPEQYPYSVLIKLQSGLCTGTIITEEWVLTAAHCFNNVSDSVEVYAGGNSLKELEEFQLGSGYLPPTAQLLLSSRIILHPDYQTRHCDIALVKLNSKFQMTTAVNMVWLATTSWKESCNTCTSCETTGFGRVRIKDKDKDDLRRKTSYLDITSPCTCSSSMPLVGFKRTTSYLCSKPKQDIGICGGDSGSGLVCGNRLRGVAISMFKVDNVNDCNVLNKEDIQCGDETTISVFLDVCPFVQWINNYTSQFHPTQISLECKYKNIGNSKIISTKYWLLYCIITTGFIIIV